MIFSYFTVKKHCIPKVCVGTGKPLWERAGVSTSMNSSWIVPPAQGHCWPQVKGQRSRQTGNPVSGSLAFWGVEFWAVHPNAAHFPSHSYKFPWPNATAQAYFPLFPSVLIWKFSARFSAQYQGSSCSWERVLVFNKRNPCDSLESDRSEGFVPCRVRALKQLGFSG